MSLSDKFNIIENHIQFDDSKKIVNKIENYFENLLNSDIKILVSDYVNQVVWFEGINIENFTINIDSHIKNFLIQRRNNMRLNIKKENFELGGLNKFIKNFITKLEYLNNIIKSNDNQVVKEGIRQLTNLIISDSFIVLFIEEQIISLNNDIKSDVELLLTLVKDLSKYDEQETFNKFLKTLGNIFKKQVINSEDSPLPENIQRIQKLNQTIRYCNDIKN